MQDILNRWILQLLQNLRLSLERQDPEYVSQLHDIGSRVGSVDIRFEIADASGERRPIEPWNELLTLAIDIDQRLDRTRMSRDFIRATSAARDARALNYHTDALSPALWALSEATEAFVKKLGRRNVLPRAVADNLAAQCADVRSDQALQRLRHQSEHGANAVKPEDRHTGAIARDHLWDIAALHADSVEAVAGMVSDMKAEMPPESWDLRPKAAARAFLVVRTRLGNILSEALAEALPGPEGTEA